MSVPSFRIVRNIICIALALISVAIIAKCVMDYVSYTNAVAMQTSTQAADTSGSTGGTYSGSTTASSSTSVTAALYEGRDVASLQSTDVTDDKVRYDVTKKLTESYGIDSLWRESTSAVKWEFESTHAVSVDTMDVVWVGDDASGKPAAYVTATWSRDAKKFSNVRIFNVASSATAAQSEASSAASQGGAS